MKRWKIREETFKLLYQLDISKGDPETALEHFLEEHPDDLLSVKQIRESLSVIIQNKDFIDDTISTYIKNWTIDRLAVPIRNILRLAIGEMLYLETIPYEVSISEAVKLAKRYGDPQWEQFVNGVLGKFLEAQRLLGLPKNKL